MNIKSEKTITIQLSIKDAELLLEVVSQGRHMMLTNSKEEVFAQKLIDSLEEEM